MSPQRTLLTAAVIVHAISYFLPVLRDEAGGGDFYPGWFAFRIAMRQDSGLFILWPANVAGWVAAILTWRGHASAGLFLAIMAVVDAVGATWVLFARPWALDVGDWAWVASFALVGVSAVLTAPPKPDARQPLAYRV